jgi:hypothetical protein
MHDLERIKHTVTKKAEHLKSAALPTIATFCLTNAVGSLLRKPTPPQEPKIRGLGQRFKFDETRLKPHSDKLVGPMARIVTSTLGKSTSSNELKFGSKTLQNSIKPPTGHGVAHDADPPETPTPEKLAAAERRPGRSGLAPRIGLHRYT